MDASPASAADPWHIPSPWILLTIGIVPIMVVENLQIALKNLRGGDNYALA
ncbi:MAG: hypothetical protein WCD49_11515 [Candidatus Acidiferrales bacterium]